MALILDESFAAGIPAGFATLRSQPGSASATYNATAQAVDLSNALAGHNIWDITTAALGVSGEMEIDLEYVSDNSGANNYRYAGAWLEAGQANVSNGFRLAHYNSNWILSRWDGVTAWSGETQLMTAGQSAPQSFTNAGDRHVLNMRWSMTAPVFGGAQQLSVESRIDGVLVGYAYAYGYASLRPGVFFNQCAVRVHRVSAWDAPQAAMISVGASADAAGDLMLVEPSVPKNLYGGNGPSPAAEVLDGIFNKSVVIPKVNNAYFGPLMRRNAYTGGMGRIQGVVTYNGVMPVGRKLRLYDEFNGVIVDELFSDPVDGSYQFLYVDEYHTYSVIAYDHLNQWAAVLASRVRPQIIS